MFASDSYCNVWCVEQYINVKSKEQYAQLCIHFKDHCLSPCILIFEM